MIPLFDVSGQEVVRKPAAQVRIVAESCLLLKNNVEELSGLAGWIAEIAQTENLTAREKFSIDICLAEVVTNCIEHGYPEDNSKRQHILVCVELREQSIGLLVVDEGIPFNPLEHVQIGFPKTLEDAPIGHLGLPILREFTTSMRYRRRLNRNFLEMWITRKA